jgi:hypothetical protein
VCLDAEDGRKHSINLKVHYTIVPFLHLDVEVRQTEPGYSLGPAASPHSRSMLEFVLVATPVSMKP